MNEKQGRSFFRRHLRLCIILMIIAALAGVLIFFIARKVQQDSLAYVHKVSSLDQGADSYTSAFSMTGMISDSATQDVTVDSGETVSQVFVQKGQQVALGDPLFSYDTKSLSLELESAKLSVEQATQELSQAQKKLDRLNNLKAVPDDTPAKEQAGLAALEEASREAAQAVDDYKESHKEELMEAVNTAREEESDDDEALQNAWDAYYNFCTENYSEEEQQEIDSLQAKADAADKAYNDAMARNEANANQITESDKASAIRGQQVTVRKAQDKLSGAKDTEATSEQKLNDATVRAKMAGVVTALKDSKDTANDGKPFLQIASSSGVAVTGGVSEFRRNSLKEGDRLSVMNYITGGTTEATVISISQFPDSSGQYTPDSGNTNSSVYLFTATLDDASNFSSGDSVEITPDIKEEDAPIALERTYIRMDGKGAYALAEKNGRLERRDLKVRTSPYDSETVFVMSGLSRKDRIAFPYGKKAKIGNRTTHREAKSFLNLF